MKVLVVLAFFAVLACTLAAPSGLLGTTIIGAPAGVITGIPVATSSLTLGPSGLIASKQVAPVGVAGIGIAPIGLGLAHGW